MHHRAVRAFSFVFIALGVVILISTFANGGGPLSLGTLMGFAFIAVGIARLWLSSSAGGAGGGGPRTPSPTAPSSPRDRTRG
jgi:uncharacterized membrane protein HdeD (DUF308 family)